MPATRNALTSLGDAALTHALRTFAGHERAATTEFIRHIAEFDGRRLIVALNKHVTLANVDELLEAVTQ